MYEAHLLRRTYREGGKVKNETLANLSRLPRETVELVRRSLRGEQFLPAAEAFEVERSLDRKSTRLNSSHIQKSRMPSSA